MPKKGKRVVQDGDWGEEEAEEARGRRGEKGRAAPDPEAVTRGAALLWEVENG